MALSDSTVTSELAAYLATGGSVEDLCGPETGPAIQRDHCPVCTLPGYLPRPVTAQTARAVARTADRVPFADTPPTPTACHPAWNGRAPPVV